MGHPPEIAAMRSIQVDDAGRCDLHDVTHGLRSQWKLIKMEYLHHRMCIKQFPETSRRKFGYLLYSGSSEVHTASFASPLRTHRFLVVERFIMFCMLLLLLHRGITSLYLMSYQFTSDMNPMRTISSSNCNLLKNDFLFALYWYGLSKELMYL